MQTKRADCPKKSASQLAEDVRRYCLKHQDAELAKKYARYFKEGYDAWGLMDAKHEFWNERQRIWLEEYAGIGLGGFLEAGGELLRSGKYEEGGMAIRFLRAHRGAVYADSMEALARWFDGGIRNWAHVDVLCGEVLGPLLAAEQIGLKDISPWRKSPHKFQRRAAAVATLDLVKIAKTPTALLRFLDPLVTDPERVVQQGTGWVLREIWKKWPDECESFLLVRKETAGRVVVQYATEKMTAEQRARFKRSKRA